MRKWVLKAIIQKLISFLPFGQKINYFFQKNVTKGVRLGDELFIGKVKQASKHIVEYHETSRNPDITRSLELGTGWFPVVPVCMFLGGVQRIHTVDINDLLREENLKTTFQKFIIFHEEGKLKELFPQLIEEKYLLIRELMDKNVSGQEILKKIKIDAFVCDARKLPFQDHEIDLITSNNTFEHIYPQILGDILLEFKRVVKPEGIMSHFIDMSDHFAHLDRSITIYNFLKFSRKKWKLIDNSIQPQNRMRVSDYRDMYSQLEIRITKEDIFPYEINEIKKIKVHAEFLTESVETLAVSHVHFTSAMH